MPHKAIIAPLLDSRTVLTNSPWGFVSLWLKQEGRNDALFFWDQAKEFHNATAGLTLQSSPLLLYYSFLNATKALLTAKKIKFNSLRHGVSSASTRKRTDKITLANEKLRIKDDGVLPALSLYLEDAESHREHSLQDIFFNLPFIHRTYCLTYKSQQDMFIPLTDCEYVFNTRDKEAYFRAKLSRDFANKRFLRRLPASFIADTKVPDHLPIRSVAKVGLTHRSLPTQADRNVLSLLNRQLRTDLQYISGAEALWYVKGMVAGPPRLLRSPLTLTLAAMHRLSEICRYWPMEWARFLSSRKNWLLSEFIDLAPGQFIDQLAAEITGHQFLAPNVRPAK